MSKAIDRIKAERNANPLTVIWCRRTHRFCGGEADRLCLCGAGSARLRQVRQPQG